MSVISIGLSGWKLAGTMLARWAEPVPDVAAAPVAGDDAIFTAKGWLAFWSGSENALPPGNVTDGPRLRVPETCPTGVPAGVEVPASEPVPLVMSIDPMVKPAMPPDMPGGTWIAPLLTGKEPIAIAPVGDCRTICCAVPARLPCAAGSRLVTCTT